MLLTDAVEMFIAHRRAKDRMPKTITLYRDHLEDWQQWRATHGHGAQLSEVRLGDFNDWIGYLRDEHVPHSTNTHRPATDRRGVAASTLDSHYRVLRAFWIFLRETEDDDGEPILTPAQQRFFKGDRIPRPRIPEVDEAALKAGTLDRNRAIDQAQLSALVDACGAGFDEESARNRAMMLMLFESGMRVTELATLTDGQIDLEARMAQILGKGRKFALVFWGPRTQVALLRYLKLRSGERGGDRPLFRGVSSRNAGGPATDNLVRAMIKRVAVEAGVTLPDGSPCHSFRRGFAQQCRRAGLSRSDVQALLRHEDMETTELYLGDDQVQLQATHRRVFGGAAQEAEGSDLRSAHRRAFGED